MKRTSLACLTAVLTIASPALANEAVLKPVKLVVGAVRQSKDTVALKQMAAQEQGKFLLGEQWDKGTDAQRKEFTQLFQSLFAKIAFPKIRENFKNLDSITYSDAKADGEKAEASSLILINHPLKKQELKLKYQLAKDGGGWKVVDVKVLGDSMLTGIRDDQIRPIMAQGVKDGAKDGGWEHLLKLMRDKVKEVSKS
jgi:phospholipid transport system substrate-binding protein